MTKSVLFVVPTLYASFRRKLIEKTINILAKQCEEDDASQHRIVVVCNEDLKEFRNWVPSSKRVIKRISGVKHSISKAVNIGVELLTDEKYICIYHDDVIMNDRGWINKFIRIYNKTSMNCGVLGIRGHTDSFIRIVSDEVEEHTFVDAIMFYSSVNAHVVGSFDDAYFGDCESQDYCYRMSACGFNNYLVKVDYKTIPLDFQDKSPDSRDEYLMLVAKSRSLLIQRWGPQITEKMLKVFAKSVPPFHEE